jgi:hypothetical protein
LNSVRLRAPSQVAGELAESAFGESAAVPDLGSQLVDSRLGAEQWSRADPGLLRQILAELRRLD